MGETFICTTTQQWWYQRTLSCRSPKYPHHNSRSPSHNPPTTATFHTGQRTLPPHGRISSPSRIIPPMCTRDGTKRSTSQGRAPHLLPCILFRPPQRKHHRYQFTNNYSTTLVLWLSHICIPCHLHHRWEFVLPPANGFRAVRIT